MRQKDQGWIGLLIYAASMLLPFTDKSLVFELSPEIEAVSLGAGLYFAGLACALAGLVLSSKRGTRYGGILGVLFSAYSVLFLAIINFAVILVLFGSAVLIYSSKRRRVRNDLTKVTVSLVLAVCVLSVVSFAVGDRLYVQGHSIEDEVGSFWTSLTNVFPFLKPTNDNTMRMEIMVYQKINEIRKEHGLAALSLDFSLSSVARNHSLDMAENGYFSHVNLMGEGPDKRVQKAGIHFNCLGENIAKIQSIIPEDAVDEAIRGWINSPGHRENILRPEFKSTGIGVAFDSSLGVYYITQLFKC